ncbi:MAG: ABC transporter permease [Chloroflexi bacterium]|nr:ABC transporter permease [Chloroflexota bacterium]
MIKRIEFYFRHSLTDLRANSQRTFFALLCIAAGVAAIVSLQTLAVMIQSTLTGNLQSSNRGDVVYQAGGGMGVSMSDDLMAQGVSRGILKSDQTSFLGADVSGYFVTDEGYRQMIAWLDEQYPGQVTTTYRQALASQIEQFFGTGRGTLLTDPVTGNSSSQAMAVLVDPAVYPFYGQVVALDGRQLSELITAPDQIVLGDMVARNLGVEPGAKVTLNGSDTEFTVTGIVDSGQEIKNLSQDAFLGIFGFYYLSNDAINLFENNDTRITTIYVQLADPTLLSEIDPVFQTQWPYFISTDTDDLRESYTQLSENIDQLVTVMGMVSLLIGSIGIVNTMQVIVRRRTLEVGVLKTLGLQADQITLLFMVEAVIMGVIGSLAGIVLGWLLTFVIRGAAEQLFATSLPFVLAAEPAVTGFTVGVVVTSVFGFLPTLSAGQVRPNIVLRPSETIIPRSGALRVVLVLVLIIVTMAFVTQNLIGSFSNALRLIGGAFFIAGIFYVLLSLLIWLIGRFLPSFGIVDLKISLRQMLAGRSRAAVTLLALVVGVFSLSLITLMAESVNNLLRFALSESSGRNVLIFAANPGQLPQIETALSGVEGVNGYQVSRTYTLTLAGLQEGETVLTPDDIRARMDANESILYPFGRPTTTRHSADAEGNEIVEDVDEDPFDPYTTLAGALSSVDSLFLEELTSHSFASGRQIDASDAGKSAIVISENTYTQAAGLSVGDKLIMQLGSNAAPDTPTFTFEIVGLAAQGFMGGGSGLETPNYALYDAFPADSQADRVTVFVDIGEEKVPALRRALADVRGAFIFETAVVTKLFETLLGTFIAFPTMVALLGLLVGGVVIANSVALTTMERSKEIAIMKSVGLQRERVLFMILLENGILGLIGGLIGVGIGLLGLVLILSATGAPTSTIPFGTAFILMLICIVVALVAALACAWGASGEKPLNVLRYE